MIYHKQLNFDILKSLVVMILTSDLHVSVLPTLALTFTS